MLVAHFAELAPGGYGVPYKRFASEALDALTDLDWPGNIRQLKNVVVRLMLLSPSETVERQDVMNFVSTSGSEVNVPDNVMSLDTLSEFKDAAEKAFIAMKLRDYEWNVSEAARQMGMPRSNLYKKIEKHRLVRQN